MQNNKGLTFVFGIIAIILGSVLWKQFDFEQLKFEHTGLAVIYIVTFLFSIFIIVRNTVRRPEK
jgi:predicted ferric reductase